MLNKIYTTMLKKGLKTKFNMSELSEVLFKGSDKTDTLKLYCKGVCNVLKLEVTKETENLKLSEQGDNIELFTKNLAGHLDIKERVNFGIKFNYINNICLVYIKYVDSNNELKEFKNEVKI